MCEEQVVLQEGGEMWTLSRGSLLWMVLAKASVRPGLQRALLQDRKAQGYSHLLGPRPSGPLQPV